MAIPWLIGLGVAAVAAAVLSDDEDEKREEREREGRRELRRIEREAEQEREAAAAALAAENAKQQYDGAMKYARQHADSLIAQFNLTGLSSQNIARLAMENPEEARERLQNAFQQSSGVQAILSKRTQAETELKDVNALLKSLESIA